MIAFCEPAPLVDDLCLLPLPDDGPAKTRTARAQTATNAAAPRRPNLFTAPLSLSIFP
jgi:hypothetical protein